MSDPLQILLQQTDAALAAPPRAIPAEALLAASQRRRAQSKRRRIAGIGAAAALASVAIAFTMSSRQFETPREMRSVVNSGAPVRSDVPAPRTPDELRAEIAALESEAASRTSAIKLLIASDMNNMNNLSNLNNFGQPHATKDDNSQRLSALSSLSSFATGSPNVESANPQTLADMAELAESASDVDPNRPSALNPADWLRVESARTAALSWHYANMVEHEFHDIPAAVREYQRLVERFPGTTWAQRSQVSLNRIVTSHNMPF